MLLSDLEKLLSVWENVLSIVNVKANRTVMLRLGKEGGDRIHHFAKGLNRLVSNLHDLQKGKKDGRYDSLVLWNTYLKKTANTGALQTDI